MIGDPRTTLFLITNGERGGAQAYLLELLKAARQRGVLLSNRRPGFLAGAAAIGRRRSGALELGASHPLPRESAAVSKSQEIAVPSGRTKPALVQCGSASSRAGLVGRLAAYRVACPPSAP